LQKAGGEGTGFSSEIETQHRRSTVGYRTSGEGTGFSSEIETVSIPTTPLQQQVVARELASHLRLKRAVSLRRFTWMHRGEGTGFSSEIETIKKVFGTDVKPYVARELASHLRLKPRPGIHTSG